MCAAMVILSDLCFDSLSQYDITYEMLICL